jgi:hypothetical protein
MQQWYQCPRCSAAVAFGTRFCGKCGVQLNWPTQQMQPRTVGNAYASFCENCLSQSPTRYVELYQNIGMLIMRQHRSVKGNLCRACISKYFWQFTTTTLFLGWWGAISFFVTLFILPNNLIRYLSSLGLREHR